jgi:hypothetical protein
MHAPRAAYVWSPDEYEPELEGLGVECTLLVSEPEPTYTGVYDANGNEIVRMPQPIGFRFGDTE